MYWGIPITFLVLASLSAAAPTSVTVNITNGQQLREYLCSPKMTISPNTHLVITKDKIEIEMTNDACLVENSTNVSITALHYDNSKYQTPFIIFCNSDQSSKMSYAVFSFVNVTNLTIASVQFRGCAFSPIPAVALKFINDSVFYFTDLFQTTFLFNHCHNLTLHNVYALMDNDGTSVVVVNSCGHSNITAVVPDDKFSVPLLNLLVYYVDSPVMLSDVQCHLHIEANRLSGVVNDDTMVRKIVENAERLPVVASRDFSVSVAQQGFNVDININILPMRFDSTASGPFCEFDCKNSGCAMSAIILFINSMNNSHVTFQGYPYEFCTDASLVPYSDTHPYYRPMHLDIMFYETPSFNYSVDKGVMNPITIQNSSFVFYEGLDLSYDDTEDDNYVLRVSQFSKLNSYQVEFESVAWCNNSIFYVAIIDNPYSQWCHQIITQSHTDQILNLKIANLLICNNRYDSLHPSWRRFSKSLILLINTNVTISGNSYIGQNLGGSAISAVSSNLTLTGDMTIRDGYSYQGGAIRLDSYSYLFLKEPLTAQFINNSALQGSAIYAPVHTDTLEMDSGIAATTSAIQIMPYKEHTSSNFTRINITLHLYCAGLGVDNSPSLYAPSFNFANRQISPHFNFSPKALYPSTPSVYPMTEIIDHIINGTERDKYLSLSNGYCFAVIPDHAVNCSYIDHLYLYSSLSCGANIITVYVYPGKDTIELLCTSYQGYQISYTGNTADSYIVYQVPCETKQYEYWNASLANGVLVLSFRYTSNYYMGYYENNFCIALSDSVSGRSLPIMEVNVQAGCPLGFEENDWGICDCMEVLARFNFTCNINMQSITSAPNHWTGLVYNDTDIFNITITELCLLLSTNCPPTYCSNNVSLKFDFKFQSNFSCLNNRTGILCGNCSDNMSVVFGSDACQECSHLYLLTIPVYALAGLLLVIALFVLRLTVATGTINGLIFYANVLELSMDVFSNGSKFYLSPLHVVISLLNLNLGFPLCFYDGMTQAAKAGLQFVFPVYLWSIVLGLIIAARCSMKLAGIISQSSVQVLATLFYLSFSKLIQASTYIVSSSTIYFIEVDKQGANEPFDKTNNYTVWLYNGLVEYRTGTHGFLIFLVAVFVIFFILPYALLLTFYPCLLRFRVFNRFRPFLDAHGGPFKDNWRFWFGLRLWIIAALLSINGALQGNNVPEMLMAHFVIILVLILLQAHIQPFKSKVVGLLDSSFMLNYLLILAFYIKFESEMPFQVAYVLLLSFAVFFLVLIVISHLFYCFIYMKNPAFFAEFKLKVSNKLFRRYDVIVNEDAEDLDEGLFEAAEARNIDTYAM